MREQARTHRFPDPAAAAGRLNDDGRGLDRRRRPIDPLGAGEGARARGLRGARVRLGGRMPARARRRRAARAGQRHPDARRQRHRAAAGVSRAPARHAGDHHDRLCRPGERGVGVPGGGLRIPAQAVRPARGNRADPPCSRGERARGARRGACGRRARDARSGAGDAGGVPRDRQAVAVQRHRADHRRVGHRQGTGGARCTGTARARAPRSSH